MMFLLVSVDMLSVGAGIPITCGLIFTSSHFYLLMESSALLAVLHVYSLRLAFYILAHLWGSKEKFKAVDIIAKIDFKGPSVFFFVFVCLFVCLFFFYFFFIFYFLFLSLISI